MKIGKPFRESWRLTQKFANPPFSAAIAALYKKAGLIGHNGQDYGCPQGTTIIACDDGSVQVGYEAGGYGNYVKIIHSWGESVYAHLQQALAISGTPIKRGQAIGFSGSTGASTAPHLHFGIRINPFNRNNGYLGYSDPEPYFGEPESPVPPQEEFSMRDRFKLLFSVLHSNPNPSEKDVDGAIGSALTPYEYGVQDLNNRVLKNTIDPLNNKIAQLQSALQEANEKIAALENSQSTPGVDQPLPPQEPGNGGSSTGNDPQVDGGNTGGTDSPSGLLTALYFFLKNFFKGGDKQ